MASVGCGVTVLDAHRGYLQLTDVALDKLIRREPIAAHYQVEHTPFARGKFAAVRRAKCLATGTWYAAKFMRKRRRAQDVRHEILHEAAVLLLCQTSPRIVSLKQLYESSTEIILVLELAAGGELQRVIDEEESLSEDVVRRYMVNIISALRFLHTHNIAHLDLKPQNLLLMGQHPESEVKLCDFGISRIILSDIEVREVLGTPDYVAPEILQYEPISLATDMWSVGVLTYVLLTGHSPFGGDTKQETFLNISQGQVDFPEDLFSHVSQQAVEFISSLLVVEPSGRLTIDEALEHEWLKSTAVSLPCVLPSSQMASNSSHPASPSPMSDHQPCPKPSVSSPAQCPVVEAVSEAGESQPSFTRKEGFHLDPSFTRKEGLHLDLKVSHPTDTKVHNTNLAIKTTEAMRPRSRGPSSPSRPRESPCHPATSPTFHHTRESDGLAATTQCLSREADGTWRSNAVNKENNKNTLNKDQIHSSPLCKDVLDSPTRARSKFAHMESGKLREEGKKMSQENKENENETKDIKVKPSPLCLRRQGSKCDQTSPTEQHKLAPIQSAVSIILEEGMIY